MKNNKCEICNEYKGKFFKSDVFGKVCLCERCVREYGGVKQAIESYELGDIVLIKKQFNNSALLFTFCIFFAKFTFIHIGF